ncbi:hypothetical protein COI_1672 [Mannheimia haemolytica serotype A2 str. OVINE]|nr:hypothetical protein COI_1672 [Mannheimia haemolytica serotype A2 str. OVINE]
MPKRYGQPINLILILILNRSGQKIYPNLMRLHHFKQKNSKVN